MFGNISAFVNGNMFSGLFGNDIFVRLSDKNRQELLEEKGASLLEPMKGKPMKEYVVVPNAWKNKPETIRLWLSRSLDWTSTLPPKRPRNSYHRQCPFVRRANRLELPIESKPKFSLRIFRVPNGSHV
jgi:TfoX/Sxy family transcriptional regulator of competence genes